MIGRQLRFYAHPDDYPAMAGVLGEVNGVSIEDESPTGEPVVRDVTDPHGSLWFLVTRQTYLAELCPQYAKTRQTWIYSVEDDPLVQVHLSGLRAGIIRPGRIYFTPKRLTELPDDFEDKSPDFVAFAEQVRQWIRRWCQKREDLWLAPSLAARFDSGAISRHGIQRDLKLNDPAPSL